MFTLRFTHVGMTQTACIEHLYLAECNESQGKTDKASVGLRAERRLPQAGRSVTVS